MINSKPRTGEAVVPTHIKHAKDIYQSRLESLGAYTCCDNVRPGLSIAPPVEDPQSGGSGDNNEGFDGNHINHELTQKAPREPRMPQQQSSPRNSRKGNASTRVEQKELINDFLSGRVREERDHTRFQQQAQLTSLAHELESSRAKDRQITELFEKLEKKRDELHQAQLENVKLQQALELRDLSSRDPTLLENLAHASNRLGLHPPYSQHNNQASSEKHIKPERCSSPLLSHGTSFLPSMERPSSPCVKIEPQSTSLPSRIGQEGRPHSSTTHEVIEILDSDEDQPPFPSRDTLGPGTSEFVQVLNNLIIVPRY